MESRDSTLKVGLVVAAAIVLAILGYTVLQDVLIVRDNVEYTAKFDTSRGAQIGTVVELDGESIGKVVGTKLIETGRGSEVTLRIRRNVPLFAEYEFVIAQDDLFGEKYINVVDPIAAIVQSASRMINLLDEASLSLSTESVSAADSVGYRDLRLELLTANSELFRLVQNPLMRSGWAPIFTGIEAATGQLDSLVIALDDSTENPELIQKAISSRQLARESLARVRSELVRSIDVISTRTPVEPGFAFVGRNRSGIGNMLAGAITETLTQAGDVMGTDEIRTNIGEIADRMVVTLDSVNELVLSVNEIVGGSEGYVTGSLANVHAMSENFRLMSEQLLAVSDELSGMADDPEMHGRWERVFANVEETSSNLARLSASLDNLAGDPALQQDIKDSVRLTKETLEETKNTVVQFQGTLERTEELMDSADSLMGDAGETIGEARQKMNQLSNAGDAIEIKMGLNVRAVDKNDDQHLDNEDIYVGDLNAAVGYEDTYVYFGADNIGEENNLNLMLGYGSLAGFSFRGGIYRDELGLGAAYYDNYGAEVMMYDTEDPKFNAYGYIPITDGLNVVVGGEDLGNDPVASVGIGVDLE